MAPSRNPLAGGRGRGRANPLRRPRLGGGSAAPARSGRGDDRGGLMGAISKIADKTGLDTAANVVMRGLDTLDLGRSAVVAGGVELMDAISAATGGEGRTQNTDRVQQTGVSWDDFVTNVKNRVGLGDLLEADPVTKGMNIWAKRGLGFLGDVAADPLTYVTGGASVAARAGTKADDVARGAAGVARRSRSGRVLVSNEDVAERLIREGQEGAAEAILGARTTAAVPREVLGSVGADRGVYFARRRITALDGVYDTVSTARGKARAAIAERWHSRIDPEKWARFERVPGTAMIRHSPYWKDKGLANAKALQWVMAFRDSGISARNLRAVYTDRLSELARSFKDVDRRALRNGIEGTLMPSGKTAEAVAGFEDFFASILRDVNEVTGSNIPSLRQYLSHILTPEARAGIRGDKGSGGLPSFVQKRNLDATIDEANKAWREFMAEADDALRAKFGDKVPDLFLNDPFEIAAEYIKQVERFVRLRGFEKAITDAGLAVFFQDKRVFSAIRHNNRVERFVKGQLGRAANQQKRMAEKRAQADRVAHDIKRRPFQGDQLLREEADDLRLSARVISGETDAWERLADETTATLEEALKERVGLKERKKAALTTDPKDKLAAAQDDLRAKQATADEIRSEVEARQAEVEDIEARMSAPPPDPGPAPSPEFEKRLEGIVGEPVKVEFEAFDDTYKITVSTKGKERPPQFKKLGPLGAKPIGKISWSAEDGHVFGLLTEKPYQRKGVATELWDEARRLADEYGLTMPVHSSTQTPDGSAWAKAVDSRKGAPQPRSVALDKAKAELAAADDEIKRIQAQIDEQKKAPPPDPDPPPKADVDTAQLEAEIKSLDKKIEALRSKRRRAEKGAKVRQEGPKVEIADPDTIEGKLDLVILEAKNRGAKPDALRTLSDIRRGLTHENVREAQGIIDELTPKLPEAQEKAERLGRAGKLAPGKFGAQAAEAKKALDDMTERIEIAQRVIKNAEASRKVAKDRAAEVIAQAEQAWGPLKAPTGAAGGDDGSLDSIIEQIEQLKARKAEIRAQVRESKAKPKAKPKPKAPDPDPGLVAQLDEAQAKRKGLADAIKEMEKAPKPKAKKPKAKKPPDDLGAALTTAKRRLTAAKGRLTRQEKAIEKAVKVVEEHQAVLESGYALKGDVQVLIDENQARIEELRGKIKDSRRFARESRNLELRLRREADALWAKADKEIDPRLAQHARLRAQAKQAEAKMAQHTITAAAAGTTWIKLSKRELDLASAAAMNELKQINEHAALWADPGTAEALTVLRESFKPQNIGRILRWHDTLMSRWKAMALLSPGFHLRNAYSAMFMNEVAGYKGGLNGYTRFASLWRKARKNGIESALESITDPKYRDAFAKTWEMRGALFGGGPDLSDVLGPGTRERGVAGDALRVGRHNLDPTALDWVPFKANRRTAEGVETLVRGPLFIDSILNGQSAQEAYERVVRFHFDYEEGLSQFERQVMRRVVPFYTWTRLNFPLQLEYMARNPGVYMKFQHAKANLELGTEEERIVPDYLGELGAVRMPFTDSDGNRVYIAPDLPFTRLGQTFDRDQLLAQLSPIIKTPLEIDRNRMYFSNLPFRDRYLPTRYDLPAPDMIGPLLEAAGGKFGLPKVEKIDGRYYYENEEQRYKVEQALPLLGRLRRLFPAGDANAQDRAMGSWLSFLGGVNWTENSPKRQEIELMRREYEIQDLVDAYNRRQRAVGT